MPEKFNGYTRRDTNFRLKECYKKIISSSDPIETDKIIKESNYPYGQIKSNFYFYSKYFSVEEQQKFHDNYEKFLIYHQEKVRLDKIERSKKLKENKLEKIIKMAEEYIESTDKDLNTFLKENNISKKQFDIYINTIKEKDNDLYLRYINHINKTDQYDDIKRIIIEFSIALENGFEENGKHRDFDVLDYFKYLDIPIDKIYKVSMPYLNNKYQFLVKKFVKSNLNADVENISDITSLKKEKRIFGIKYDKFGKIIEGSGRELTIEEKENIINYLFDNKIPVNRKTYNVALKRYINGFLEFNAKKLELR